MIWNAFSYKITGTKLINVLSLLLITSNDFFSMINKNLGASIKCLLMCFVFNYAFIWDICSIRINDVDYFFKITIFKFIEFCVFLYFISHFRINICCINPIFSSDIAMHNMNINSLIFI